ncbi:Hemagluttinin domain protein [Veillonella parvula DSM 2008]|uniref:YadA-like family protein n=1 Tax=Veillonella parvula TaxID=29466 RepID=UPI00019C0316|nr:YadA-like family protein [Veillonella parvula]ACZ23731.1 Hemagluttinin domain protein [Veillonella parvula DSM 2008]QQB16982.1 YadA-like family protein [Veillonella parvula]SNU93571.1 Adhesin yadA precursor [Veillonella parvula]
MNRIYNVIWSKTKKCYVVVSEIVKTGGGKVKSVQTGTTWARMSAVMAVAALLMGGNITTANAATYAAMTIDAVNGSGYATGNVVYGEGSYLYNYQNPGNLTPFDNSHLYNGTDRGNYTENSFAGIAIGTHTNIQETAHPTYYSGLAIGNYAQATGGISFALGHYAQALSPSAMALGTATKASGFNSLAMMRQSAAEGEFSTALGTASWAKGNGSFAMGYSATAKADQSIAIGAAETIKLPGQQHGTPSAKYNGDGNTVTEGARSLAFGTKARTAVGADDSMAFGSSSSTGGANAVAMGYSANASAENAFAIGNTAQSSAQNAVAMGKSANASGVSSFAMGSSSNAAGADAIAMGSSSQAKLSNSIALGGNAKSLGADALALGGAANASKDGAIAIGKEAKANNTNTTAIGLGATVTGTNSMAIGTNAVAESNNSLALGTGTEVRGALVNGFSAFTNQQNNNVANGVVAVGNVGSERRIINVAGGENDTDATNVKQLKFVNSNLAKSIAGPTYTGYEANGSTYKAPDFNIKNSTYHTVKEAVEAAQTNFFSAKGTSADANYDNTGATGNNATAAGVRASAAGNFATAVGADATAANANSTAIGYKAKSSVDDGVALGANSVASVAAGTAGYNVKTADSRTNGYSGLTGAALTSTMGAVSVGDGGTKTRQITNVAAGTADTDAVNVAQLRNVNLKVAGNTGKNDVLLDNQTLTVKGDGSYVTTSVNNQTIDVTLTDATKNKIDNAANKDLSNITDGGKSVIRDEAQKAVKVVAGKNTTVTEGTDGTYKTYKVDVDAPDYQLVENSSAADKAYTVSGNKVDLTVQDAKNPANKKTVTIKDIASKTELDTTKTELINKGLKFDADNGGEKTNKLGSKVTVAGDGTNINTTITQTGDDTTIKVALGQDINVNTVTATKTVKAGTATMGTQSVTDNKSAAQNGNFVSGLDNKSWTLTDPTFVSGRAATEDQLKIVSDAVKAANASASDYRLIANPNNAADGSYKVDNNKVDLQVKDEKSSDVKTVTIKDIASKTELDKVKDRSVKYDGNTGHDTVTLEGPNGTKITNLKDGNVAAGSKDAVNGGQLHQVKQDLGDQITNTKNDLINTGLKFDANVGGVKTNKLGSTVTIQGEGTAADADYSGENLKTFIKQDAATGNTTIDVKMNKNLKVESVKVGKNGKDGVSITGPDTANGTDGKVAVTDKNGNEAVSISGKDGVGHIGLTGPAGTNGVNGTNGIDLSVKPGYNDAATGVKSEKGVDGTNGLTRIVYTDGNGEHQVATMEDGLQFTGNNTGTVNKQKLNSLVKVQGEGVTEAESTTFKSASGNINVKADGTDKLELQLAKDLKNLDSVTAAKTVKAGSATMGGQTVNNAAGDSETGNYVTGLDNKDWDANKIVSGRAATEDQLKKALDAQSANSTDYRLIKNQAAGSNGDYTVDANGDVALTVQDKNHPDQTETVTIKDVASKSKLDKLNDRAVKYDLDPTGNPDKSKVTYEGPAYNNKQGGTHVTNVAYATGNDGSEAVNVDYLNDKIKDSADALTNKGLKFDANQGGEKTNKLGSKVTIKGEGTAADEDYSGENIKTFIKQDAQTGDTTIDVKMNKNLKAESVKVGKDGKEAVSISGKDGVGHIGLNGKDGRSADISVEKGDPDLNGNEITRIKYTDENGKTHQVATKDDGMAYGGDSGDVIKRKLNTQVNVKGGVTDKTKLSNDDNIGVVSDGTDTLMLRLAKDLKGLNSVTFNNGANGKTVVNGEGMTIKDAAGNPLTAVTKDGVKITDGPSMTKDGIDAAGNKITNVQDGNVAKDSKDAVNGGQLHTAIEDIKTKGFGLEAEDGQSVKKALGETVKVKGDDTNIKTSVDGGAVKVELKKDITVDTVTANTVTTGNTKMDTNGVTIKDGANEATKLTKDGLQINDGGNKAVTINKDGLTIENGPKVTKDGIDAANKKITNVADGTIGAGSKDAVNGGQLHTAIEDIKSTGFGLKAEDGNSVKKPLGETIDLKGDGNIKTSVDNGAIKMALNDKITLGQDPAKQVNIDGSAGTITAGNGGNQVKIDGNDGSVTANTVKAGDVVVGKQTSDGKEGNFVTGLDNKTWDPENPVAVPGRAATEDQLKAVNDDFNNKARTGRVFQGDQPGDSGKVVRGLGDTMNLTGGADVNRLADNNIGVVKNSTGDGYNIKLAKDLKGLESVTTTDAAGNTTVMNGGGMTITPAQGNAVSLTKDGLNNGGNRITNVGPGVDGTDAVNVNQLSSAMRSVDGKIADVGATSAAISGLKPLQYDPLEPTQVLAAVGHYKGSTAAAVGVAHYTNESTMFHMGVSLGGHDNMINAGVSYKFGTSDAKKAVPARYKAGPISSAYVLQDEVTALKAENERMKQHDLELTAKYDQVQRDNEEMKAQIALLMQQAGLTK